MRMLVVMAVLVRMLVVMLMFMRVLMVMVVRVDMVVMALVVHQHIKIGGLNARFEHLLHLYAKALYPQAFQTLFQHGFVRAQIQQGGNGHIAADAGKTFKV